MSTRSFVGVMSDAGILGAYVHGDGHPSWVGTQVQKILKRDGFEKFGQTILEGCEGGGFSWLDADTNANQEDRRCKIIGGYGGAYTDESGWLGREGQLRLPRPQAPRPDHHPSRVAGRAPFPAGAVVGRAVHQSLPDPPRGGRLPNRKGRRMSAYNKKYGVTHGVTHGVIMNLCAEENVYREALATVGKYDDRDAQAHALRAFVQLLRCTGVVQTYSLTELRDADLDKVDWLAVAEGVGE